MAAATGTSLRRLACCFVLGVLPRPARMPLCFASRLKILHKTATQYLVRHEERMRGRMTMLALVLGHPTPVSAVDKEVAR